MCHVCMCMFYGWQVMMPLLVVNTCEDMQLMCVCVHNRLQINKIVNSPDGHVRPRGSSWQQQARSTQRCLVTYERKSSSYCVVVCRRYNYHAHSFSQGNVQFLMAQLDVQCLACIYCSLRNAAPCRIWNYVQCMIRSLRTGEGSYSSRLCNSAREK